MFSQQYGTFFDVMGLIHQNINELDEISFYLNLEAFGFVLTLWLAYIVFL